MDVPKPLNWSLYVGRGFLNIPVRLHWTFLALAAISLFNFHSGVSSTWSPFFGGGWFGTMTASLLALLIVFSCVYLHELGHSFAALRGGIQVNSILLHPLGGFALLGRRTRSADQEMTVTIAGPMTNVVLMGLAGWLYSVMIFFNLGGDGSFWDFPLLLIKWFMFANGFLAAFNMIPLFPFDGGAMLRAFMVMRKGELQGTVSACWLGQIIAVFLALCGVVMFVRGEGNGVVFILLALFGFISCRREEYLAREGLIYEEQWDTGVRWSDAPADQGKSVLERWREARALKKTEKLWAERKQAAERKTQEEQALRARVDALLAKVKNQGLDALTPDERRELREASEKFKRRDEDQ